MSGGTRCNITHATDNRGIVAAYGPPGRFLHSALAALSVAGHRRLLRGRGRRHQGRGDGQGLPRQQPRRRRARRPAPPPAPQRRDARRWTSRSLDLRRAGRRLRADDAAARVRRAAQVILTTGGQSYPGSGTTGDGYASRRRVRPHHRPAAAGPGADHRRACRGWRSCAASRCPTSACASSRASRPLGARAAARCCSPTSACPGRSSSTSAGSSAATRARRRWRSNSTCCRRVPEPELDELPARRVGARRARSSWRRCWRRSLPRRLCEALLALAGLPADRKAAALSKADRSRLVRAIKRLRLPVTRHARLREGGGDGRRRGAGRGRFADDARASCVPGLYLAGEVLDLDGPIGGYNFQAAWSTGWLAGGSVWTVCFSMSKRRLSEGDAPAEPQRYKGTDEVSFGHSALRYSPFRRHVGILQAEVARDAGGNRTHLNRVAAGCLAVWLQRPRIVQRADGWIRTSIARLTRSVPDYSATSA